ncbi:hypothetical protein ACTG9Q_13130 [Actinokineospora sp. 24-640]
MIQAGVIHGPIYLCGGVEQPPTCAEHGREGSRSAGADVRLREHLAVVDRQIRLLYEPLVCVIEDGEAAWGEFRSLVRPGRDYLFSLPLIADERKLWKEWMTAVFMPGNRRAYELIVSRPMLVADDEVPDVLGDFCAHVARYEVILGGWARGDDRTLHASSPYPKRIRDYANARLAELRTQRRHLTLDLSAHARS